LGLVTLGVGEYIHFCTVWSNTWPVGQVTHCNVVKLNKVGQLIHCCPLKNGVAAGHGCAVLFAINCLFYTESLNGDADTQLFVALKLLVYGNPATHPWLTGS